MKHLLRASLLVVLALPLQAARGQVSDSLVLSLMDEYHVPGLSLAVVQGDSTSTFGWGYADAEKTANVTPDTPFRLASVAKVLVAATVVTEAARGTISLEENVSFLVPPSGRFSGPITLHDLLTHTAGFDERLVGYGARTPEEMKPLGAYLRERMPARGWPVGEQISYSNHGMALAALAVERASGRSFAEVASRNVFEPLGMHATGFLTRVKHVPPNSAAPLSCDGARCEPVPHFFSHAYPAGLAFSTAHDMSAFITALLHADASGVPLAALIPTRFTNDDRIPGMSYGFFNQRHRGVWFLAHSGTVPGYWSLLMISPEADLGFFFATNGGHAAFGERFRDVLLTALLGPEQPRKPEPAISVDASERAGVYEMTRYSHDTIERFPQVFANSIELFANGDTLKMISGGSLRSYIQIGEELYENTDGTDRIAFGMRRGEPRLFRSSFVYGAGLPVSYEKRPWYRAPGFLNEYVSWLLGVPVLIVLIFWPLSAAAGLHLRRRLGEPRGTPLLISGSVWGLAVLTAVAFATFGLGFVARSNRMLQTGELFFGMPDVLLALAWIPPVHTGLVVAMLALCILAWRKRWWGLTRRLLLTVLIVFFALQVVFLVRWNYLPMSW